jgi:glutaredoxin
MKKSKIIMYTTENCGYCAELKKQFDEKKVKYTEKPRAKFEQEWYKVIERTGLGLFPTVVIEDSYFVPGRDFMNPEQLLNIIDYRTGKEYESVPVDIKTLEELRTMNFNLNSSMMRLNQMVTEIKNKLEETNKESE